MTAAKVFSVPAVKLGVAAAIVAPIAIAADAPIHDPFFDILGLILLNAIVTGAPEPDMWKTMSLGEFLYLWYYRASHGFLGSATAYFGHKNIWPMISGQAAAATADSDAQDVQQRRVQRRAESDKAEIEKLNA